MTKIKSEMIIEVKPIKPKSYKELKLLYENLSEEYEKLTQSLINQEKKNRGLEKTIKKLKDRIGIMDRNLAKTIKAWNKERQERKSDDSKTNDSQPDTPKDTKKETKVCEIAKRDKYPWMAVGC